MGPDIINADRSGPDGRPPFGRSVLGQGVNALDTCSSVAAPIGPGAGVMNVGIGIKKIAAMSS